MIKKVLIVLSVLGLALSLVGCGGLPKSAVAEVNGKVITREDLDKTTEQFKTQFQGQPFPEAGTPQFEEIQRQIVQQLVNQEIILFEAEEMGITVSEEDVNAQIDQLIQLTGGEEQLNEALSQVGTTLEEYRESTRQNLIFQKVIAEVTKEVPEVTDEAALAYYNQNKDQFQKPETRKVRHILVADEATANQVKTQLDAGGDFTALAQQFSTDPGNKDKGGDLGEVTSQNSGLVAEFEQAMNQLTAGQISGPVKTSFGYHIIKVDEIIPAGQSTFEEVKEDIKSNLLMDAQRSVFDQWLKDAEGRYEVVIADEFKQVETTSALPADHPTTP